MTAPSSIETRAGAQRNLSRDGARPLVLVTGANGFIGTPVARTLRDRGLPVLLAARQAGSQDDLQTRPIGDIARFHDWESLLRGVNVVVHLANRAHAAASGARAIETLRRVNVEASATLARAAARAGVQRFVYLSSIHVNGRATHDRQFSEADAVAPDGPYALSKWEAEQALHGVARDTALGVVVVRSPLVYGPGVKGNLRSLLKLIAIGLPLPLGSIRNQRSFIGVQNLADLIAACVVHPRAPGQLFLAADGEDISTPELVRLLASAMGRRARVLSVPIGTLRGIARLTGQLSALEKLTESLQVDARKARTLLDWQPPVCLSSGLEDMAKWYRHKR